MISQIYDNLLGALGRLNGLTAYLFWTTVTSPPVLIVLAVVVAGAFLVAHVPRVARLIPAVDGYARAAGIIEIVAAAMLIFGIGFRVADAQNESDRLRREADGLRQTIESKNAEINNLKATAADASRLRNEAEGRARDAKGQLDAMRAKLSVRPKAGCGFTDGELGWVRSLQRRRQHR